MLTHLFRASPSLETHVDHFPFAGPPLVGLDGRYLDPHYPGIGRYVFELARALPAVLGDMQLSLLHRAAPARAGRFDLGVLEDAGVHLAAGGGPPRNVVAPWRLRRQVRAQAIDLWHAPYFPTSFGPACPRVVTVYDTIALEPSFLPSASRRLLARFLLRTALLRASRVLTLSQAAKANLVARCGLPPERIAVTPAGVGTAFRPRSEAETRALRDRLRLPERYVLFVGADRPHKNLAGLLEGWRTLQAEGSDDRAVTLVLAGFDRNRLIATNRVPTNRVPADRMPAVRRLGPVAEADLPALLSGAEVFVFPSLAEGFGLPVLEAMACGTPVACSTAGSLPEVAGEAALFFDPKSAHSMASALGALLDAPDLRQRLARAGIKRAARFSWHETARTTAAVYRDVLGIG